MTVAHPFLKFAGGKTALLPLILPRLPKKIKTYYEPFVGGGAVFFALAAEGRFKKAVIGDSNQELVNAYIALTIDADHVIRALEKHVYEEKYYYDVRAQDPNKLSSSARAARFIYLNKTCFNGLWRVNKAGHFNVPFGRYTNPMICDEENLRVVETVLRGEVSIWGSDFEERVGQAKRGDAVYFDPPYAPASKTANFTAYTKGGFGLEEQVRLRDVAAKLVKKGVHVLLSNSNTPLVRRLYRHKSFYFEKVQAPRRINSKGGKRGDIGELLISGRIR